MQSSATRKEQVKLTTVISVIEQLAVLKDFKIVNFAGGEPTLLKDDLLVAIRRASELQLRTRLVTNASWASSEDRARNMLVMLRNAGLKELNISADDFHLPFIPVERVATAWHASKGLGFSSVSIVNCITKNSKITPTFLLDLLGEPKINLTQLPDGHVVYKLESHADTSYLISSGPALRLGRALDRVDAEEFLYETSAESIDSPCPHAIKSLALSPSGKLVACCSTEAEKYDALVLGDADVSQIEDILNEANHKLMLRVISKLGPVALMRYIQSKTTKIPFRDRYTSMCEVCEHLTSRPEVGKLLLENISDFTMLCN
jgi:hypothetical protein